MKRKHNPIVSLAALVLLIAIMVLTCTGCYNTAALVDEEETDWARFTSERYLDPIGPNCYIITDNLTGVQYLYAYERSYGGGVCVLQGVENGGE